MILRKRDVNYLYDLKEYNSIYNQKCFRNE